MPKLQKLVFCIWTGIPWSVWSIHSVLGSLFELPSFFPTIVAYNLPSFLCNVVVLLSILRSRRLEVMDAKKNGTSEGNTRGEKELPLPSRVSLSRRVLFCAVTSKRQLRRLSLILIFCLQNLLFIYLFGKKITHYIKLFLFCFRRKSKRKLLGVRTTTRWHNDSQVCWRCSAWLFEIWSCYQTQS